MKNYFHLKDNIIDKKLLSLIDSQNFATRKIVNAQIHELVQFFSENFTNGNKDKAHDLLEQHNAPIRKKDAMLIAYFVGLLTMITFAFMVLIFMPQSDSMFDRPGAAIEIYANFYVFRFLLMILCTILSTTYAIKILRSYKVNYPFIFDLDPHYKVTYMQLLRVSLMLLTIWAFCFLGQLFIIKLAYVFPHPVAAFALILTIAFILICFAPFHCLYLRARKELLVVLYHIVISPFGLVRFKHFFLADIITSFVVPLKDVGYIVCFFFNGLWLQSDTPSPNNF